MRNRKNMSTLRFARNEQPECKLLLVGRCAQTLWHLHKAGEKGITALEVSSWALRLGAYVHTLRRDYGLNIITLREPHDGGYHGRYVLKTPVQIVESSMSA
jgi:hypothetical protein